MTTAKPRIVLTRRLPDRVEAQAADLFDILPNPGDSILDADEIVARAHAHKADGLLVTLTDRLDADAIARLPQTVKAISTYSVGFNHIDLSAATGRGILLGYAPEAVTQATADLALLLILAACRRAHEYQAVMREGRWAGWTAWKDLGTDPGGKVLGIVGMGRIGQEVAKRAGAFGMEIHYHQRTPLPSGHPDSWRYHPSLEGLFRASRIVSLHTPSTAQTLGWINATSLGWLSPGAIFVNTARGDQVDDDALVAALESGYVAAAGLDVFAGEPNFDKRYLNCPNAYLLPHIGTSTVETRERMGHDALANLSAAFANRPLPWPIPT
jgi:glyoxylate reductase